MPSPTISGEPELVRQYETLKRDLTRPSAFAQVADETFRREALILDTDRDPTGVVLRRTAAQSGQKRNEASATNHGNFAPWLVRLFNG